MTQCPVCAVPRRMLQLKDVAGPQRTRVTIHSRIVVKMDGAEVRRAVDAHRQRRNGGGAGPEEDRPRT